MNKKNIWLVNRDLPPVFTGAGRNDVLMAKQLPELGFSPTLVGQRKGGSRKRGKFDNIDVLRIGNFDSSFGKVLWGVQLFFNVLFSKDSPELIRFRGYNLGYALAIFLFKTFLPKVRVVIQPACFNVDDPSTVIKKKLGDWQLSQYFKSDALFAMNGLFRQSFIDHGYASKQIFSVRNPVIINEEPSNEVVKKIRSELTESNTYELVIVTIGILDQRKKQDLISTAFCNVYNAGFSKRAVLVHIGPNSDDLHLHGRSDKIKNAQFMEEKISIIGSNCNDLGKIKLLGHRPDVAQLLAAADIFIHASVSEGEANVVNEAMAAGVAVIVPNHPVYELQVSNKVSSLFVPDNDNSLTAAMLDLMNNEMKREQFGMNAKQHVINTRYPRKAAKYYAEILNKIVGNS